MLHLPGAIGRKTAVCLGFFDGVHLGHARLIEAACYVAKEQSLASCVHTFDKMPARVLRPSMSVLEITPLKEKAKLMAALGIEIIAVSRFDERMARMRADVFFREILLEQLSAAHIVAGFHHRFGFMSEAGTKDLAALCEKHGMGLTVVPPVRLEDGSIVSSTAIRAAIEVGDFSRAEQMLGRPYAPGGEGPQIDRESYE